MAGEEARSAGPPERVLYDGSPVLTGVVRWMQEGVVLHDREGRIVEASPSACELLGVPEDHLIGISDPDVFGDEPIQAGWRMIDLDGGLFPPEQNPSAITARTGEPASAVMGVHRPDGSRVWLSVSSVPLPVEGDDRPMVLATFVDVTERVEARNRLAESEERFRLTLQHAPIGMATVDLDGTYLSVNPRLAEMLGRRPEELIGVTFAEVTHPDDVGPDLALSQALVEGRIDSFELDKRYVAADGSIVWAHLAVALVRGEDGEPLYWRVPGRGHHRGARAAKEQLEERVLYDPLTGLANRVLIADRIHQVVSRSASPAGRWPAVLRHRRPQAGERLARPRRRRRADRRRRGAGDPGRRVGRPDRAGQRRRVLRARRRSRRARMPRSGSSRPDRRRGGRAGRGARPRAAPGRVDRGRHRHRAGRRAATSSSTTPRRRSTPPRAGREGSGSCSTGASGIVRCDA